MAGLEKKGRNQGRQIVFVDESGFYLTPGIVRTYAPYGDRPVLKPLLTRDHLSVISGVTLSLQVYTQIREKSLDSLDVLGFLDHLLGKLGGPLLLIWDGSPIHRSLLVKHRLSTLGTEQVWVEFLPTYAPELNPDEGAWNHLKLVELRNLPCQNLRQLRENLHQAILRLRSKPKRVETFFQGAGLSLDS